MPFDLDKYSQERYDYEASRRGELTGAVGLPLGILTGLLGALAVIAKELHSPFQGWAAFQLVSVAVAAVACLVAGLNLALSYFNYTYRYLPTPLELRSYRSDLINYHLGTGKPDPLAIGQSDAELHELVQLRYAQCAHHNTRNNDLKSFYLHVANGYILVAAMATVAAGAPYVLADFYSQPKVPKVEVINLQELKR